MAGQMVSERRRSTFNKDEFAWILSGSEASEVSLVNRVKSVLSHFAGGSPPYLAACEASAQVRSRTDAAEFNAAFSTRNATVMHVFDQNQSGVDDRRQWLVFKALLGNYCPPSAISEEEKLRRVVRRQGEQWSNFIRRYVSEAKSNQSSTEHKTKTLYKQLPPQLQQLVKTLPENTNLDAMAVHLRRATYWEDDALTESTTMFDEDAMDIDHARRANAAVGSERVVLNDGRLNFRAITSTGRVMMGAREICKQSKKEAMSMMKFLQRIAGQNSGGRRFDRRSTQSTQSTRRRQQTYAILEEGDDDDAHELPDDTLDDDAAPPRAGSSSIFMSKSCQGKSETTVLMLPVVLETQLGFRRQAEGLIDTGAERTIVALGLVKELGVEIQQDDSKLVIADGKEVKTMGKCNIKMRMMNGTKHQSHTFEVTCLILPKPGYELLLGMDFMVHNDIAVNPRGRFITMEQKKQHCKTISHISKQSLQNHTSEDTQDAIAEFTEKIQHLPVQQGERILFPLNRSIQLGPKEKRMIKMPVTLRKTFIPWRSPTVAPHFSVSLGPQHQGHLVVAVENHKMEPVRLTGRTVIFEVSVHSGQSHAVKLEDGSNKRLKIAKSGKSFQQRQ